MKRFVLVLIPLCLFLSCKQTSKIDYTKEPFFVVLNAFLLQQSPDDDSLLVELLKDSVMNYTDDYIGSSVCEFYDTVKEKFDIRFYLQNNVGYEIRERNVFQFVLYGDNRLFLEGEEIELVEEQFKEFKEFYLNPEDKDWFSEKNIRNGRRCPKGGISIEAQLIPDENGQTSSWWEFREIFTVTQKFYKRLRNDYCIKEWGAPFDEVCLEKQKECVDCLGIAYIFFLEVFEYSLQQMELLDSNEVIEIMEPK